MSMSEMEKVLESISRELAGPCNCRSINKQCQCVNCDLFDAYGARLKRRLLPLLEAGQAMRDAAIIPATTPVEDLEDEDAHPLFVSMGTWDAALKAILERP